MDELIYRLTESTVYLLGDSDLITLWEYVHTKAPLNIDKSKGNKINKALSKTGKFSKANPVDLGEINSRKEYNDTMESKFKSGELNRYNYRTFKRNEETVKKNTRRKVLGKIMNHRSYKRIKDDYKDQGFSDRKAHLKTLNDLEKGGSPSALRELQKNRREDLFNVKAAYNPYFNSLLSLLGWYFNMPEA
jgi:hypothetical protein